MKRISRTLILFCLILALLPLSVSAAEEYITPEEAAAVLKEAMLNRETPVTVYVQTPADGAPELLSSLLDTVYTHTGVPTEGDYLQWHVYSTGSRITWYTQGGYDYATLTYTFGYCDSASQEAAMLAKYNQVMAALNLNGKSEYEKVKAIYDYIAANVTYDYANLGNIINGTNVLPLSAYAALMNGTAVCQGYANLFYRMALDAGLDCRIITGIGNGGDHAWNIVRIGGIYYNLDVTWDEGTRVYSYFLKGSQDFPDHTSDAVYLTTAFTSQYPISKTNYDPSAPGCSHDTVTLINALEPTCTADGYSGDWKCDQCSQIITTGITIAATGHTEVLDFARGATCVQTGLTAGSHCSVCGTVILAQEVVPMTDHSWDSGTVTLEPTEDQEGETTYTCTVCSETKTEPIAPIACIHEVTELMGYIPAGCKTVGYSGDTVCSDCGETLTVGQVLTATGHSWDEGTVVREPTCDQPGQLTYTCLVCGDMKSESIAALCGSYSKVDCQDTIVTRGISIKDPMTDSLETFSYDTPDDGVTMLIFFSYQCPNCRNLMENLDTKEWMTNPYLNVVAVECVSSTAPPILDFINQYTPNTAPLIDYYYAGSGSIAFSYYRLFSNSSSLMWPLVLLIDDSGTVCYGASAATSVPDLYNTLLCTSEGFAQYENAGGTEEPDLPVSNTVTVQMAGMRDYDESQEVLRLTNEQRTANGLEPLILDQSLLELAMLRAAECSLVFDSEHTRPNGTTGLTILDENGILYTYAGENIACGYSNAAEVTEGWMNSPGHRQNILNSAFTHIGIGCVVIDGYPYWVQILAQGPFSSADAANSGQVPFQSPVEVLKSNLVSRMKGWEMTITTAPGTQWDTPKRIAIRFVSQGDGINSCTTLIPILSDFVDANGNVIATLEAADDGTGELIITQKAEGTGTATLPLYSGDPDPVLLTLTVQYTETSCLHTQTTIINAIAAACTQEGYTGDTCCTCCGEIIAYGEGIPALGHAWDSGTVTTAPTANSEGVMTYTCANCAETETEIIPALDVPCSHSNTRLENAYAATCEEHGYSGDTVCIDCGTLTAAGTTIPALGHSWDDGIITLEPTVNSYGEQTHTCRNGCGTIRIVILPPLDPVCSHENTTVISRFAPTCTREGYTGDTVCDDCGEVVIPGEAIPATGHSWDRGTVTTQPTETTEGVKTFTCTNGCGALKNEAIPVLSASGFTRIAGANRFETAFAVADAMKEKLGIDKFDSIIVASGTNFADALSGSYLAAVRNAPILLSFTSSAINDTVKDYIRANLNPGGTVYILGGTNAVPASMESGLDGFFIRRLAGADRFGTNLAILEEAGVDGRDVLVCTGLDFADSLSASAAKLPILLVWRDLTQDQKAFLKTVTGSLYVIGGTSAVSDKLMSQLGAYGPTTRLGGGNRFQTSVLIAQTFFPDAREAVLAYAWGFPDGLCGGPLAAVMDAPLILTMSCYEETAAGYTTAMGITRGFVLGGTGLISDESLQVLMGSAAAGHSYLSQVIAPTCTEQGYTEHTCQKCGKVTKDTKTPALGHTYSQTIVYPTFDQGGYTLHTCDLCGHTKTTDKTSTLSSAFKQAWTLINEARAQVGLEPLSYCFEGQQAADIRAEEIQILFSSDRPSGGDASSLFDEIGLDWQYGTELLGMGYGSARAAVSSWLSNEEYRAAILNAGLTRMVIGCQHSGWVLLLLD